MKKVFLQAVSLIVVICALFSTTVYAESSPSMSISDEIEARVAEVRDTVASSMKEIALAEAPAQELYDNLLSRLQGPVTQSGYSLAGGGATLLNDYYGGAYLNDNKRLTICSTSDDPEIVTAFEEAADSSAVDVKKVSNTIKQLNETANMFQDLLSGYRSRTDLNEKQADLINDITESYTDVFINRFVIGIDDLNEKKEQLFWSLFSSLPVKAIELKTGGKNAETVTIRPGGGLYTTASGSTTSQQPNQSVGYRGYRVDSYGDYVYGFTGCGHGAQPALYRGGEKVGTLYDSRNGGNYDIAFYDATETTTLSNMTSYSDDMGNANETVALSGFYAPDSESILIGSTVMKVGSRSFYTQGTILSINTQWHTSSKSYTNAIRSTALNLPGDSGGAAFIYYDGYYRVVGTMSGSSYSGSSLTASTFTCSYIASDKYARSAFSYPFYRY